MPSKIKRRSGKAVTEYMKLIEFAPEEAFFVGVGINHAEVDCLLEEWPDIAIYGFEPHPDTFQSIKRTFPGILYNKAVSNYVGKAKLYSKPRHADGASFYQKIDEKVRAECVEFEVAVTTLDNMFVKREPGSTKGLLWLDCEGEENNVLEGAERFIVDSGISVVNVELTGKPRSEGWCRPVDVHNLLMDYGFLPAWCHTTRSCIGQCDLIYLRKEIFRPEYCSIPDSINRYNAEGEF